MVSSFEGLLMAWRMSSVSAVAMILASTPSVATVLELGGDGRVIVHSEARERPARAAAPAVANSSTIARPPRQLRAGFEAAARSYDLSPELIEAVAAAESRFKTDARSPAGAIGVMQLMPATARDLGVDPQLPGQNIRGGTAYLRMLLNRYAGDVIKALAAYNAGPGAVDRHGGVPPYAETQAYVARILGRLAATAVNTNQEIRP